MIAPLVINICLLATVLYVAAARVDALSERVEHWLPGWLDWLSWLLWPLFIFAALLLIFFGFSVLANLIAAPFNGLLANAVERYVTGRHPDTPQRSWLAEVASSVAAEGRKLRYFLPRALGLGLLFLIPGVNLAAPFLWLFFCAWMMVLEYADYPMANHGLGFAEQRRMMTQQRSLALGFGAAVMLALMVPGLNCLVIPSAVAGATLMWLEAVRPGTTDPGNA